MSKNFSVRRHFLPFLQDLLGLFGGVSVFLFPALVLGAEEATESLKYNCALQFGVSAKEAEERLSSIDSESTSTEVIEIDAGTGWSPIFKARARKLELYSKNFSVEFFLVSIEMTEVRYRRGAFGDHTMMKSLNGNFILAVHADEKVAKAFEKDHAFVFGDLRTKLAGEEKRSSLLTLTQFSVFLTQQEEAPSPFALFGSVRRGHTPSQVPDSVEATRSGMNYWFKRGQVVALSKGNMFFQPIQSVAQLEQAIASHAAILRKQGRDYLPTPGRERNAALTPSRITFQKPFAEVRKKFAEWTALVRQDGRFSDIKASVEKGEELEAIIEASIVDTMRQEAPPQASELHFLGKVRSLLNHRMFQFRRYGLLSSSPVLQVVSPRYLRTLFPDLSKPTEFQKVGYLRFIYLRLPGSEELSLVVTRSNVLHYEMLLHALGSRLVEEYLCSRKGPNPLSAYVRGGVLRIDFAADGNITSVGWEQSEINIPEHNRSRVGAIAFSEIERAAFEDELNRGLFEPPISSGPQLRQSPR